jgi:uncharacterized protein (DUF433 family)
MDPTLLAPHVDSHPEKCGGKPCVAGTRVRVWDVAHHIERLGKSPDEVIQAFPRLTLADVYGAMAYYWDHRQEVEERIRQDHLEVEALMRASGEGLVPQLESMRTNAGETGK